MMKLCPRDKQPCSADCLLYTADYPNEQTKGVYKPFCGEHGILFPVNSEEVVQ